MNDTIRYHARACSKPGSLCLGPENSNGSHRTFVLGGCFDPEFEQWSTALVTDFRAGRLQPLFSDLLAAELVAMASVASADVVASWNFRHIVRFDKIQQFNAVNLEAGYKPLAIHSPRELASDESDPEPKA